MAINRTELERHPDDRPTLGDVVELIWLPALGGIATAAITWLIWYYTIAPCTPELAPITGCNPAPIARYISVDLFGRMLTYGAIVASGLGFWRYEMIKRERAARIAAENRAIAIQQQAAEERQQAEAERQQAAAERERFMTSMNELVAAERQQAAVERERFMTTIDELVAQVNQLVHQRNGNHGGNNRSTADQ